MTRTMIMKRVAQRGRSTGARPRAPAEVHLGEEGAEPDQFPELLENSSTAVLGAN